MGHLQLVLSHYLTSTLPPLPTVHCPLPTVHFSTKQVENSFFRPLNLQNCLFEVDYASFFT